MANSGALEEPFELLLYLHLLLAFVATFPLVSILVLQLIPFAPVAAAQSRPPMHMINTIPALKQKRFSRWYHCGFLWCLGVSLLPVVVFAQEEQQQSCDPRSGQCDTHERCPIWSEEGECTVSRQYMMKHCPWACGKFARRKLEQQQQKQTQKQPCQDKLARCQVWSDVGECDSNPEKMRKFCPLACGVCGADDDDDKDSMEASEESGLTGPDATRTTKDAPDAEVSDDSTLIAMTTEFGELQRVEGTESFQTLDRIEATLNYMNSDQVVQLPERVRSGCKNRHELCSFWAILGECENNRAYMATSCAPACRSCHLIDFKARCPPLPADTPPALTPGQLDAMFIRIVATAPGNQTETSVNPDLPPYTVHIHSSPAEDGRPWVLTLDSFLTNEEADALIQHGYEEEYKRSEDVGTQKFDGSYDSVKSEGRTSENAWCSAFGGCRWKEVPNRILERISSVTGIPATNSEDLQLLKYEEGQFYHKHHDYIVHQRERNCGPRILTFFLYLSDVEAGGGTDFPSLGITIQPKRGRALLWPSVLNDEPLKKDRRMEHQALPVIKGTKFAANAWLHMYDYVEPQTRGCN